MFRSLQRSIVLVSLGKREFAKLLNEIFSYFLRKKKWKFTFKLSETNFLSLNNYFAFANFRAKYSRYSEFMRNFVSRIDGWISPRLNEEEEEDWAT